MNYFISYLSDFMNAWTLIDLSIMFALWILFYNATKKTAKKEQLLKFSDIEKSQLKEEISNAKMTITYFEDFNVRLKKQLEEKTNMLSRCIDRPRKNGKFIKATFKPIKSYKAKESIKNSSGELVFIKGRNYFKSLESDLLLVGENCKNYLVDIFNKFEKVY